MALSHGIIAPAVVTNRAGLYPSAELIDRLHRAARFLCRSPDAEDLVQETFAQVLARPRAFRAGDPLPYLLKALRNTYLTSLRTASRRPQTTTLATESSGTMQSLLAQPEAALEKRLALDAIAGLSDDFRATLIAVDVIGLSYREAATALGTGERTVATRLFRARERLTRALRE
jgi:RNA polymerase sigma-70 factor, ECF subfamily